MGCPSASALALHAAGRVRDHASGRVLIRQGDPAAATWLILDGTVRCEVVSPDGRPSIVATHQPGDMIGAFGQREPVAVGSMITAMPARLLALSQGAIEGIALGDPAFGLAIARVFARQAEQLLHRLAARLSLTAPGRINARLLELAGGGTVIEPAPVVAALAVSVQTTRETASRAISNLERRGIVRRERGRMIITSPRMLEEMVI